MAPTTRSSRRKKKKSPGWKKKNPQLERKNIIFVKSAVSRADDDSDVSSDGGLSTDSEMEELVRQTALKMIGSGSDVGSGSNARGETKRSAPNSDTASAEPELSFVLDSNPMSAIDVCMEVDRVSDLVSEPHNMQTQNEVSETEPEASKDVSSPRTNSDPEPKEEEEFISLAADGDSQSKNRRRNKTLKKRRKLTTKLDPGLEFGDTYFADSTKPGANKTKASLHAVLQQSSQDKLLKNSIITPDYEKSHSVPPYREATRQLKRRKKKERESSMGKGWYDMPAAEMTNKLRNDIRALRMRATIDPKRFYKNNDMTAMPKFVQIGTVMDNPADFYHSRVPKKQRKQTIVEELLADADSRRYNKRKYLELQERFRRPGPRRNQSKKGQKKGKK